MRLILVRHPKPLCDPGLCYGRLDLACDAQALKRAALNLRHLAGGHRIVSSPARRAFDLAITLSPEAAPDPRLQELNFGDWEGLRWQDIGRGPLDEWRRGLPHSAPPNGESLAALAARCSDWLKAPEPGGPPVLAITHAGPIRVIRALLKGEPLLTYFETAVPFAEPLILESDWDFDGKFNSAQDKIDQVR